MTIKELIDHQNRVRELIEQDKKSKRSPLDIFEQFLAELVNKKIDEITPVKGKDYFTKEEIHEWLQSVTPIKGVHYFDGEKGDMGEKGAKGERGERGLRGFQGEKGKDGKDGKNLSPKEARIILAGLLKDLEPKDIGALDEDSVAGMLSEYEKKSGKNLEKRLNALQDAVMRNYGGHGMSTSKFVSGEVVSGSGTSWTLANSPTIFLGLYAQGQKLSTARGDYTINGASIMTTNSWAAGDLESDYYK